MSFTHQEKHHFSHFVKKLHIEKQKGWRNFSRNLILPHALVLDIKTWDELQQVVKELYRLNATKKAEDRILLRVVAGGMKEEEYSESFSFTEGGEAEVIVRLVGEPFHRLQTNAAQHIVKAGASLKVGDLDKRLYDLNFALSTASLIPYVTVAGLAANAGHGTGINQPSFAGLVKAFTLCLPNGEIVRIKDPTRTDLDSTPYDMAVSAEEFNAIRGAHLGLFGIVLDVELEVIEAKKLKCEMRAITLPQFLQEVKNGLLNKYPYFSVMYVPTYQQNERTSTEIKNVVVYTWEPVDKNTENVEYHPLWTHLQQEMEVRLQELSHIDYFLKKFPALIPLYMKYIVTRATVGHQDKVMIGPWPMVHYQTAFPWNIGDVDFLFQVSPDHHEIGTAFEKVVEQLQEFGKNEEYPVDYAIYARYFAGTNGGLSTSAHEADKRVCGFDIVASPTLNGYQAFREAIQTIFLDELNAKFHWGKYVPDNLDYAKIYGDNFDQFNAVLKSWYDKHHMQLEHSMLVNRFFSKILHLPLPAEVEKKEYKPDPLLEFFMPIYKYFLQFKILPLIYGEDEEAENFRRAIQNICKVKLTDVKEVLFPYLEHAAKPQDPAKEALNKKSLA